MSETKLAWPHSTCAECGKKIPAGQQQRCEKGGLCDWHIPAAVLALLTELTNAPALTPEQAAAGDMREALDGDGTLGIDIGHLTSIVWHLEKGDDNAGLDRVALARFLASVGKKLSGCIAALAKAGKP